MGQEKNSGEPLLELCGVTVGYRKKALISDISFTVKKGRMLALVGPNGAGKSTVLKTIAHQLVPVSGDILLGGKPLGEYDGASLAKRMAVLFPERRLPVDMTCYEMAAAGRYPYTGSFGRLSSEDERVVEEALCFVGASAYGDRRLGEISDGQRQRVRIARVIAQQPELIVMDEPTAFLDIRYKLEILTVLRRIADERGVSVVLSLHDADLAGRAADDVLLLYTDHSWRWGEADGLMTEEKMRRLYDMTEGKFDARFSDYRIC